MSKDENPSAFPVNTGNSTTPGSYTPDPGMSLRDYFAASAIGAVIRQCAGDAAFGYPEGVESMEQLFAQKAFAIADAMLAERAKGGEA